MLTEIKIKKLLNNFTKSEHFDPDNFLYNVGFTDALEFVIKENENEFFK